MTESARIIPPTSQGSAEALPDPLLGEYMDRHELARQLGVSLDTLSKWSTQRIGPPRVRLGRRILYRREAVREWLRLREDGSVPGRSVS